MSKKIYNLIYATYFWCFGPDEEYENANHEEYEKYAIEMLEEIKEYSSKTKLK